MIRALIADDHAIVRRGLKALLDETGDIVVEGEAGSGKELLALLRRGRWDVLVLDLNLPDQNGLDLLVDLKRDHPKLPVLVLSMSAEDAYAVQALRSGASGYVTKGAGAEEVVQAIRKVAGGGRYVGPGLAERLALLLDGDAERAPHERLSEREFQVFRLLAAGLSATQAAERLSISVKTVSTYRARILEKMLLQTNADLTLYAVRNNLID